MDDERIRRSDRARIMCGWCKRAHVTKFNCVLDMSLLAHGKEFFLSLGIEKVFFPTAPQATFW